MPGNLQQRLIAAKKPFARVTDNEALLVDLRAEVERLGKAREVADGESIDFALSEADRDEAAAKAARLERTMKALEVEIAEVAALTEKRKSEDAHKAKEAEKRAALTERNELAARFAERVPALTAELIALLKEVKANAERMKLAGVYEADAELVARGIPANGHVQSTAVLRFIEMKIPAWENWDRAWPIPERNTAVGVHFDYGAALQRGREDRERQEREKAEAAAKFARENGRYEITVLPNGTYDGIVRIPAELAIGNVPAAIGPWEALQRVIPHELAEKLGKVPHLKVRRLDGGKS